VWNAGVNQLQKRILSLLLVVENCVWNVDDLQHYWLIVLLETSLFDLYILLLTILTSFYQLEHFMFYIFFIEFYDVAKAEFASSIFLNLIFLKFNEHWWF